MAIYVSLLSTFLLSSGMAQNQHHVWTEQSMCSLGFVVWITKTKVCVVLVHFSGILINWSKLFWNELDISVVKLVKVTELKQYLLSIFTRWKSFFVYFFTIAGGGVISHNSTSPSSARRARECPPSKTRKISELFVQYSVVQWLGLKTSNRQNVSWQKWAEVGWPWNAQYLRLSDR